MLQKYSKCEVKLHCIRIDKFTATKFLHKSNFGEFKRSKVKKCCFWQFQSLWNCEFRKIDFVQLDSGISKLWMFTSYFETFWSIVHFFNFVPFSRFWMQIIIFLGESIHMLVHKNNKLDIRRDYGFVKLDASGTKVSFNISDLKS